MDALWKRAVPEAKYGGIYILSFLNTHKNCISTYQTTDDTGASTQKFSYSLGMWGPREHSESCVIYSLISAQEHEFDVIVALKSLVPQLTYSMVS